MRQKTQPEECLVQGEWRRSGLAASAPILGAREVQAMLRRRPWPRTGWHRGAFAFRGDAVPEHTVSSKDALSGVKWMGLSDAEAISLGFNEGF